MNPLSLLDELFRENHIPMSDRNAVIYDALRERLSASESTGGEVMIVGGIRYFDREEGDYGVMEFVTEKGDKVHLAIDKTTISWMVMANDKAGTLLSASAEHPLYATPPPPRDAGREDA